ncbi:MAG: hypothetical protein WCQ48_06740 [Chloroflexota bacterium]|nr:MAG: hypothetical protein DWI58_08725 [Chloroflexota bacterium]
MPQYIVAQYGDRRRYLVKALREIGHRITRLASRMDDHDLGLVAPGEDWSVTELIGYLRDSEREDLATLEAVLRVDGSRIGERQAMAQVEDGAFRHADPADLLWDFATLRDETVWLLESAGTAWNHVGIHPFRGEVPVMQWVQEMNERDLDAMWRIQRAHDALRRPGREQVTGLAEP